MAFKVYLGILQEKNLKAEEEHRRQQKERAEMEKLRQAEERKRFVLKTARACVVDTEDLYKTVKPVLPQTVVKSPSI